MNNTLKTLHGMDNLYRAHCNEPCEVGDTIRGMLVTQWHAWVEFILREIHSGVMERLGESRSRTHYI